MYHSLWWNRRIGQSEEERSVGSAILLYIKLPLIFSFSLTLPFVWCNCTPPPTHSNKLNVVEYSTVPLFFLSTSSLASMTPSRYSIFFKASSNCSLWGRKARISTLRRKWSKEIIRWLNVNMRTIWETNPSKLKLSKKETVAMVM